MEMNVGHVTHTVMIGGANVCLPGWNEQKLSLFQKDNIAVNIKIAGAFFDKYQNILGVGASPKRIALNGISICNNRQWLDLDLVKHIPPNVHIVLYIVDYVSLLFFDDML